ncbi:MAG: glycine cleavage system protein R, partial [Candidatus Binatia bacterium]
CELDIFLRPLDEAPVPPLADRAQRREYALTAVGVDKAGIVASVARILADEGVSITDLRGFISPAPQSGTPIYTLKVRMDIPEGLGVGELRNELAAVSSRLNVDIRIEEEAGTLAAV